MSTDEASFRMAELRAKEAGGLTQELIRHLLDYDAETGALTHRRGPRTGRSAVVLRQNRKSEEVYINIPGKGCCPFGARRIIWLWVHGVLPERVNKCNRRGGNQLANLRLSLLRVRRPNAEMDGEKQRPTFDPLPRVAFERIGNIVIHRGVRAHDFGDPPFERSALARRLRGDAHE